MSKKGQTSKSARSPDKTGRKPSSTTPLRKTMPISLEPDFRAALKASEVISEHGAKKDVMKKLTPLIARAFNAYGWGVLLSADPLPQFDLFLDRKLSEPEMINISTMAMVSYSDFAQTLGEQAENVQGVNLARPPSDGADIILTCDMFVPSGFLGICFLIGDGRRHPTLAEIRLFSLLANQLSAALENSRLHLLMYSEIRMDKPYSEDIATGLPGKKLFSDELAQEIKRSSRYGNDLTCLFVDFSSLDRIKRKYNSELYNRLLGQLGALARKSIREVDLAARFSASQLAMMLPDTGPTGARVVANRFLDSLDQIRVSPGRGKEPIVVNGDMVRVCLTQSRKSKETARDIILRSQDSLKKAKAGKHKIKVVVTPKGTSKRNQAV
ncbi:MAG: diguanylate cyclase [Planctomycetota bacterium]|nr:diguanylate cyclase [Planctomycetota bacterium]